MRIIYLTLVSLLFAIGSLKAQITFTAQDMGDAGTKIAYKNFQGNLPLGSTGADQTWDYSNQPELPVIDTAEFLNPASTLFGARFPQSNIAINDGAFLSYYRKAANGFFLEGLTLDLGGLIDETPVFRLNPSLRIIQFPSTFGNSFNLNSASRFTFRYDTVVTVTLFGVPVEVTVDSVRINATFTGNSAMNGWGNLILPPGISFPSLRQQINQTTTFAVEVRALTILGPRWVAFPISLPRITNNSIRYWTNNKSNAMLEINLDSANRPLTARYQPPTITDIQAASAISGIRAYPNPFKEFIQVAGAEPGSKVSLMQLDGKLVIQSGEPLLTTEGLKPGLYLLEVRNGDGMVRQRLKMVKQ